MDFNYILIFLLIITIIFSVWLYLKLRRERNRRKTVKKENQQLLADNLLLRNENLKFQLQPHTLNNILANLKVFSNKLNKGLDSLSETLEYIIYKGNNHLVSVQDELHFIKKYMELNDLFIHELDAIQVDATRVATTSRHYHMPCIPHLITAYFIENAFKHGDINHPEFLRIHLHLTEHHFALKVANKIKQQPLKSSGGLGLKNMTERLDMLLPGKYEIERSSSERDYITTLKIHF
jgi:two-component system LytT family sensor kinase